jgi:hypothetical protein
MKSCPICNNEVPLVEHHIHGREVPRWREAWNVAWICGTCHDLVHLYEVIIEGWFNVDGVRTLVWRRKEEQQKLTEGAIPPRYSEN